MDQTLTWYREQKSRAGAVEISYLREAYEVTKRDSERNEDVYEIIEMQLGNVQMDRFAVMKWVKRNTFEMIWPN